MSSYELIESQSRSHNTLSSDIPSDDDERTAFIQRTSSDPVRVATTQPSGSDGPTWLSRLHDLYLNNIGLLLIALSQFFSSCMNIAVKILNGLDPPVPPFELVAIRMTFTYVFSVLYMYHQRVPHSVLGPPGVRHLLVIRGIAGFFGIFGMYYALQYISLSDAVVLTFLTPNVVAISGYFLLGEGFSKGQALASVCSLIGVTLIARPPFIFGEHQNAVGTGGVVGPAERGNSAQRLGAVGVSLLGVLGVTGAVTCLRAIGTRAHPLHSLTYFSSYSIFVSIIGMLIFRMKVIVPGQWQWGLLFLVIGLFGYAAQVTLVMGLQRETASRGMLAKYIQIVYATILERIFFNVYPSYLSLLGTTIILSCAIYVALTKKVTPRPPKSRIIDVECPERDSAEVVEELSLKDLSQEANMPDNSEIEPQDTAVDSAPEQDRPVE